MRKDKKMVMSYRQILTPETYQQRIEQLFSIQPRIEPEMNATFGSMLKMNCTRVQVSKTFFSLEKTSVRILYGSQIPRDILYTLMFVLEY